MGRGGHGVRGLYTCTNRIGAARARLMATHLHPSAPPLAFPAHTRLPVPRPHSPHPLGFLLTPPPALHRVTVEPVVLEAGDWVAPGRHVRLRVTLSNTGPVEAIWHFIPPPNAGGGGGKGGGGKFGLDDETPPLPPWLTATPAEGVLAAGGCAGGAGGRVGGCGCGCVLNAHSHAPTHPPIDPSPSTCPQVPPASWTCRCWWRVARAARRRRCQLTWRAAAAAVAAAARAARWTAS